MDRKEVRLTIDIFKHRNPENGVAIIIDRKIVTINNTKGSKRCNDLLYNTVNDILLNRGL